MTRKFTNSINKFCINLGLFVLMLVIDDEIFSSICLLIFFSEFVFWIFKNLPKNY